MPVLGFDVPNSECDAVFEEFDKGGEGSISYKEMKKLLSAGDPRKEAELIKIQARATYHLLRATCYLLLTTCYTRLPMPRWVAPHPSVATSRGVRCTPSPNPNP